MGVQEVREGGSALLSVSLHPHPLHMYTCMLDLKYLLCPSFSFLTLPPSLPLSPPLLSYSLTEFDASHNQITYVPSGLFQMPELSTIQLSYNLLNHLPGDPEDPSAQTSTGVCILPAPRLTLLSFPLPCFSSISQVDSAFLLLSTEILCANGACALRSVMC